MDCLENYIGIMGCGSEVPPSGLYVNELPGITLNAVDKTTEAEQVTYLGVWRDVQKRAQYKLVNAVNSFFRQRYILKTIRETLNTGYDITDVTVAMANEYRGVEVRIANLSALQSIYITSLNILLQTDVMGLPVKVFDLQTGTALFTVTIDGVSGWNKVDIRKDFKSYHIFAGYDASVVDGVELELGTTVDHWCECTCNTFGCEALVRGATLDATLPAVTATDNKAVSISAVMSIRCSYDSFTCENLDVFKTAYWYLLGAELLFERLHTSRLNRFTTVDMTKVKDLRDEFIATAEAELETALTGICLNTSDACLECNEQYVIVEALP